MTSAELLEILERSASELPFDGHLELEQIQQDVFRLSADSDPYFMKWIPRDNKAVHDELGAHEAGRLASEELAPSLKAVLEQSGGRIAIWEWLEGGDLRVDRRDRLPEAFSVLAAFHQRRRHDGPLISPHSRQQFSSASDLVSAEQAQLVPLVEAPAQGTAGACLDRLRIGYGTYIHGDMHPGNVLATAAGLRIVDWSLSIPSLNLFDLDYVESVALDPPSKFWAYMLPPESESVLKAYASRCGLEGSDILQVHLAVMLWRELGYLEHFLKAGAKKVRQARQSRARIAQLLERA
jgi:thiamine kinase-like enzyme